MAENELMRTVRRVQHDVTEMKRGAAAISCAVLFGAAVVYCGLTMYDAAKDKEMVSFLKTHSPVPRFR